MLNVHIVFMFGHAFRDKYFTLLEPGVLSVNHGSYGLSPTPVLDKFCEYIRQENAYPDRFFLVDLRKEYVGALELLANKYLHCDYHDLALVDNASIGVNTFLRLIQFSRGDKFVVFSTVYGACYNTLKFLEKTVGIVPVVVDISDYPWEDNEIIDKFKEAISGGATLALFDTVSSMPGVRLPFEELTKICRENNVISVIDGAHGIGLIDLDLGKLQPDFFVSNLHKWLYVPRGCAIMYVAPHFQGELQTFPISHSYVDADLVKPTKLTMIEKFVFFGTKNYASLQLIKDAVAFRENECGGEANIADYCTKLSEECAIMVLYRWPFARVIANSNKLLSSPGMVSVVVDFAGMCRHYGIADAKLDFANKAEVTKAHDFVDLLLVQEFRSRLPFVMKPNGEILVRLSCQVYNEASDYEYAFESFGAAFKRYFSTDLVEVMKALKVAE